MAEEEEKESKEEEAGEEGGEQSFLARNKLVVIIAGVFLLLLVIGTPILFFALSGGDEKKEDPVEELAKDAAKQGEGLLLEGFDDQDEYEEGEERLGAIFPFRTFVVNLNDNSFLRVQVQVEFEEPNIPRKFRSRIVPITDSLIELLGSRASKDVATTNQRDGLKGDIREVINKELRKQIVKRVYFTQFVVQ